MNTTFDPGKGLAKTKIKCVSRAKIRYDCGVCRSMSQGLPHTPIAICEYREDPKDNVYESQHFQVNQRLVSLLTTLCWLIFYSTRANQNTSTVRGGQLSNFTFALSPGILAFDWSVHTEAIKKLEDVFQN